MSGGVDVVGLAVRDALAVDPAVQLGAGPAPIEVIAGFLKADRERWLWKYGRPLWEIFERAEWYLTARTAQRAPAGDWRTWLILAGRGFGKTRAGAEWVLERVREGGAIRIALVAATFHEGRTVMVEGESGLLARAGALWRPEWEASNRRLFWPKTGAHAFLYSADAPEGLRGPQHHHAWCDEIGKWPDGEAVWANLAMGLRLGSRPRTVVTTTPRAVPLVRRLAAAPEVATTRGRTADNAANLATGFVAAMQATYGGTLTGRQELDGELIEEIEGALWSRALIERQRCAAVAVPALVRTVVGVDPPAGTRGDACGIVVAALGEDGAAYVLADASVTGASPEGWAAAVARAAATWGADRVVAEANQGGAMVESVLRAADMGLPVKRVHAAQGKAARAEPVQALYERGRAWHAGTFPALEDELCGLMAGGGYEGPGRSPDRADACVWALWELMLGPRARRPGVRAL